jgi:steroid 5-alpha reductase family enzyme
VSWLAIHGWTALLLLGLFAAAWLLSLPLRDSSIVDVLWGPAFAACAWLALALAPGGPGPRSVLVCVLVTIWALRLGGYIAWRNHGRGEDPRYARWRREAGPSWWWRSGLTVFLLQATLVWVISTPLLVAQREAGPLGPLDLAGVLAWLVGFVFEAGGDLQLARFKADPSNRGQLLTTGLWAWTRHPNYFGDACLWWGYWLIAAAAGGWWTVFAPALMTALIVKVSGVALLERDLKDRKPGYADYVRRTSAFLPWPPKRA